MAQYSPPSRNYPQELPDYWRFEDGTVRTDLKSLTDAELEALGWHGPITMPDDIPNTSKFTHNYTWNPDTLSFDAVEVDENEKLRRIDYLMFWGSLRHSESGLHTTIKSAASQSLEINTIVTDFILIMMEARIGNPCTVDIVRSIEEVLLNVSFTEDQMTEFREIISKSGMFVIYNF